MCLQKPLRRLLFRTDNDTSLNLDLICPQVASGRLKLILDEEKASLTAKARRGQLIALQYTYICLRLMEGADIYQIAKNCRTGVEMIEKYYASHIKTSLDAVAINVMRPKKKRQSNEGSLTDVA